jgi:hypothetical protein
VNLFENAAIQTLIQPEYHSFFEEAYVPICTFILRNTTVNYTGSFIDLKDFYGASVQEEKAIEAIQNERCAYRFSYTHDDICALPGSIVAFRLSRRLTWVFEHGTKLVDIAPARLGLFTGDNEKYMRNWSEVSVGRISFGVKNTEEAKSKKVKWVPHNKGGAARKWYGNRELVVDFENDGANIKKNGSIQGYPFYFHEGITWTGLTVSANTFRYCEGGFTFDINKGPMLFESTDNLLWFLRAQLGFPATSTHSMARTVPIL